MLRAVQEPVHRQSIAGANVGLAVDDDGNHELDGAAGVVAAEFVSVL